MSEEKTRIDEDGEEIPVESTEPVRYHVPTPEEKRRYLRGITIGSVMFGLGMAGLILLLKLWGLY